MFSKLLSVRPVAVLLAALLLVVGVQLSASAATARSVSVAASPAVGVVGTAVTFSGKVTKSPKGTIVLIQRKSGKKWVKAGSTRTVNAAGSYAVRLVRSKALATYSYRAYVAAKAGRKTAISKAVSVAALKRTYATLSATPASTTAAPTTAGTAISLAGNVFPFVRGTKVTLQRKVGSSWSTVGTTTVTANGTFSQGIVPSTSTTYRASVARAGSYAPVLSNLRDVAARPLITTTALAPGNRLHSYSATLATYGAQAGTWTAAQLPDGLVLNASKGIISGTPKATGDYNVVIGFKQLSTGLTAASKTFTLQVFDGVEPVITTTSLPAGSAGVAYDAVLAAQGNPSGTWSAAGLPAWATLNPTSGVISGTPGPDDAGTDAQVTVGFTASNGLSAAAKVLTLQVDPDGRPVIGTASLPNATRLSSYTTTLTAVGNPTGTWGASPLPAGLELNPSTGVISGTPTAPAPSDTAVVITFTQAGTGLAATPKTLMLHVSEAAAPVISTTNLPEGNRLSPYTTTLTAVGNPTGTWGASPLPAGLELNPSTGVISGTPTAVETKDVVITFTQTNTGLAAAPKTLTLTVGDAVPPVISTTVLPDPLRYHAYSAQLTAAGNPVGTWTATGLPAGLAISASGLISGTPPNAGDSTVTVKFTQTNTGLSSTKTFVLHVVQSTPVITSPTELPDARVLQGYSYQLQVAPAPVGTWKMVSGSPPLGITLKANGLISGTAILGGGATFTVKFTETSTGLSSQKQFHIG